MRIILFTILLSCIIVSKAYTQESEKSTLKILVEHALGKSHKIKMQESEIKQSQIDKRIALMGYLPQVTTEMTYTKLNDDILLPDDMTKLLMATQGLLAKEQLGLPFNMELPAEVPLQPVPPIQEQKIFKAHISAQIVLFSGLKIPYAMKACNRKIRMSELLTENEKAKVIKEVVITYDRLAVITKSEEVLNNTENYLNEQARFVQKAFDNGLATDLELQQIELARQELEAKRIELSSGKKLLYAKLEQLSGLNTSQIDNLTPEIRRFPLLDSNFTVTQRKDLQALDQAITATDYKRKMEYTEYIPKVFAFGKKELTNNDLSAFDPEWYVGIGVRWTVFDKMNAHNKAQKAKVESEILKNRKADAAELLNLNLQSIQYKLEKNMKLADVADKRVKISERSYQLSRKQYENDLITLNEHLKSVNDLEKAKLDQIQAIYEQRVSVIELYEASGKLYETALKVLNIESE